MQKVLLAEEMREVDRLTAEEFGIPSILLMENAAQSAARIIAERFEGSVDGLSVLILCGKGNNGGDGAALARALWTWGADVEVVLLGKVEDTSGDARTNFEAVRKISELEVFELDRADLAFEEIETLEEWLEYDSLNFHSDDPDVLVDALFGTGLTRPLEDMYAQAAAYVNAFCEDGAGCDTLVVAIDVPSGLDADKCEPFGPHTHAHLTVTFTAPKAANVLPPVSNHGGELYVAQIGSPMELVDQQHSQLYLADREDAEIWLGKTGFSSGSYKNKRGHAFLIAGAKNYAGAAVLCGNAAIRTGVGLVTLGVPESVQDIIGGRVLPEIMVRALTDTSGGALSEEAFASISEFWENVDVVAFGSGVGRDKSTGNLIRKIIDNRKTPVVIDADGLTLLAPFRFDGHEDPPLILTPHEGEFLRLLGRTEKLAPDERVGLVREFAVANKVILVLKGERNLIAAPSGQMVINPTGNSGLGKAGNGDTLTGIITGFVAQAVQCRTDIFEAVVTAVYIAGFAGDIAESKYGKRVMTASDVRECLADAFKELES
jgi:ADP-dependent NAD(P)H-hydrate dehydratase / NAD(P)H-hydrate epimerase